MALAVVSLPPPSRARVQATSSSKLSTGLFSPGLRAWTRSDTRSLVGDCRRVSIMAMT